MFRLQFIPVLFFCFSVSFLNAQFSFDSILSVSPKLKRLSVQKKKYHLQIIYTQIKHDSSGTTFTDHYYNVSPENYVYCASLVKLPVSALALKKLNEIGISDHAIMFIDSAHVCQYKVNRDTSTDNGYPSVEQYIKKMLLVSDNFAYNRCFEFLGTNYIHENLMALGFTNVRIVNRYELNCEPGKNNCTNPIRFMDTALHVIYSQKSEPISTKWTTSANIIEVGKGYWDMNNNFHSKPKDFSGMNYLTLSDAHKMLKELLYGKPSKWGLSEPQRKFLETQLSLYPRQSKSPKYNSKLYPDNYKKYLYYGDSKEPINDSNLVVTNCVGQSYGFLSDCARFMNKNNNIEFMLSAAVYVNENEIINDGKYEYTTLGLPFLAELGKQIYAYELKEKNRTKN